MKLKNVIEETPPEVFHDIGRAVYALYLGIESNPGERFTLTANGDGRITSPEGLLHNLKRLARVGPLERGDRVELHTRRKYDLDLSEDEDAEGGSSGSTGPAAPQGEAGDAGAGAEHSGPAGEPESVDPQEEA